MAQHKYSDTMVAALATLAHHGRVFPGMSQSTVKALVARGAIAGAQSVDGTIRNGIAAQLTAEGWRVLVEHDDMALIHEVANCESDADEMRDSAVYELPVAPPAVDADLRAQIGREQTREALVSSLGLSPLMVAALETITITRRAPLSLRASTVAALVNRELIAQSGYMFAPTARGWAVLPPRVRQDVVANAEAEAYDADAARTSALLSRELLHERMLAAPATAVWHGERYSTRAATDFDLAMSSQRFGPVTGNATTARGALGQAVSHERAAMANNAYCQDRLDKILRVFLNDRHALSAEVDGLKFAIWTDDHGDISLPVGASVIEFDTHTAVTGRTGRVVGAENSGARVAVRWHGYPRSYSRAVSVVLRHEIERLSEWQARPAEQRTMLDTDTLHTAAAEATTRPSNFLNYSDIDLFDTWGLTLSRTRDSDLIEESNYAVALRVLREACQLSNLDFGEYVTDGRSSHWLNGWQESIAVKVWADDDHTVLTYPFVVATEIAVALQDYPLLDEEDHSERELDAAEAARDDLWRWCVLPVIAHELGTGEDEEDFVPLLREPLRTGETVQDLVMDAYYAHEDTHWYEEAGTGMVNDSHDTVLTDVISALFRPVSL